MTTEYEKAMDAQPVAWVAADTLNSPHPTCVSSLAYVSQLDKGRGREYVPLYAAPAAAQTADDNDVVYLWDSAPPIPRWVIDSADRIAKYMDANWPGEWALGRIQSRAAQKADDARDAERYRWLRKGAVEDVAVVRGLGAMDYGMSAVVSTYSEEIDGDDLDAAIDQARGEGGGEVKGG